ncbi:hypothetical protein DPMN_143008 [Dreissena polymorpha]|uniref:Sushi domain-containing protein n=1 Tax=Dreissena polymorpha TaxID=45954 RepID=A0A9D4JJ93_DREPO|nr:hypothetical protein DPMN_143008 [Dreissena polymorpha]
MTYQGTNIGHTSTYTCLSGYQHSCGDLYRTCTGSGAWSGSTPVCGSERLAWHNDILLKRLRNLTDIIINFLNVRSMAASRN